MIGRREGKKGWGTECVAWLEKGRKLEKTGRIFGKSDGASSMTGVVRKGVVGGGDEGFAPLRLFLKTVWMWRGLAAGVVVVVELRRLEN
jgi:hypothetical protein